MPGMVSKYELLGLTLCQQEGCTARISYALHFRLIDVDKLLAAILFYACVYSDLCGHNFFGTFFVDGIKNLGCVTRLDMID